MSIVVQVDKKNDLTMFTLKEKVTVEEVREHILTFYQQDPTRFVLWDTREADIEHLSEHNIRHLVETASKLLVRKEEGKTAIVADAAGNIRTSSMAETFSSVFRQTNPIKVFESIDEAYAWLRDEKQ